MCWAKLNTQLAFTTAIDKFPQNEECSERLIEYIKNENPVK